MWFPSRSVTRVHLSKAQGKIESQGSLLQTTRRQGLLKTLSMGFAQQSRSSDGMGEGVCAGILTDWMDGTQTLLTPNLNSPNHETLLLRPMDGMGLKIAPMFFVFLMRRSYMFRELLGAAAIGSTCVSPRTSQQRSGAEIGFG